MWFKNPLGLASGWNKNGTLTKDLWKLGGLGFIEVGTVTPLPQKQNPGKVLDHEKKTEALWNHMGFPNKGVNFVFEELKKTLYNKPPYSTPLFINVGQNRTTDNQSIPKDYTKCLQKLHSLADVFVINVSSPNTLGLKNLRSAHALGEFLSEVIKNTKETTNSPLPPLLVKLAPDYSEEEFEQILEITRESKVDGWVITNSLPVCSSHRFMGPQNTSLENSHLSKNNDGMPLKFLKETKGGISGRPLKALSLKRLQQTVDFTKKNPEKRKENKKLIVSVGGVLSPQDVFERLKMGADLVQVYSAVVLKGPWFFHQVCQEALKKHNLFLHRP